MEMGMPCWTRKSAGEFADTTEAMAGDKPAPLAGYHLALAGCGDLALIVLPPGTGGVAGPAAGVVAVVQSRHQFGGRLIAIVGVLLKAPHHDQLQVLGHVGV